MKLAHIHLRSNKLEPLWHVYLALLIAIGFQFVLTSNLTVGPKYIITGFELSMLCALALFHPHDKPAALKLRHIIATILIVFISSANITSLILVLHSLFGANVESGKRLILSGFAIFLTNIIVFGLWYWELDNVNNQGKSPGMASNDFLFPQMTPGEHVLKAGMWSPTFFDYLYVSATNASAFSPTDTMPLTHRAKLLMAVQSLVSLLTVALVTARAINILG
jgi:hypothetical protein